MVVRVLGQLSPSMVVVDTVLQVVVHPTSVHVRGHNPYSPVSTHFRSVA